MMLIDLPVGSRRVTHASLNFLQDSSIYQDEKPYYCSVPLDPSQEHLRTNIVTESHQVSLIDLRQFKQSLDLETNGFQFLDCPRELQLELNESNVSFYLEGVAALVKSHLRAQYCFCYDHRFRKSGQPEQDPGIGSGTLSTPDEPAISTHADHTFEGGLRRIQRHIPKGYEPGVTSGKWRMRIINVWKPLFQQVEDYPLAFCDPFSVDRAIDFVATDRVMSSYVGEVYLMKYHAKQRWYWLTQQTPCEMSVFTSFDSDKKNSASFVPHASFKDPSAPENAPARQSIEARYIVLNE
ncbi:hypothetical protein BDZ45DRAFT_678294 [Acephala macrosclerotiorum]|nr:hypothetical protein BDZ45DRAFT_678294 [Acephala macrosclerotiorum]